MERYKVAIIIPAFNEEETIYDVATSLKKFGTVIVVNDASTDNTENRTKDARVVLINHKLNKGYDQALNTGFEKALDLDCNVIITFDADGQHNNKYIELYIQLIKSGFHVVAGQREEYARVSERIFSLVSKKKWGIIDPLCGMKAYHADIYKKLGFFDSYQSIGTELLLFSSLISAKIAQPLVSTNIRRGKPRFGNKIRANFLILRSLYIGIKRY